MASCQHILSRTHSSFGVSMSLLLCINGLRKQSSGHAEPPFLAVKLFSHSVGATISQEGCGLSYISARYGCNDNPSKWNSGTFRGSMSFISDFH